MNTGEHRNNMTMFQKDHSGRQREDGLEERNN